MSIQFGVDLAEVSAPRTSDGIFTNVATIVDATIAYNVPVRDGWSPSSIVLDLEIQQEGLKWNKKVQLFGDYSVEAGQITSMGSAFRVWEVLTGLRQNGSIKDTVAMNEKGQVVVSGIALTPALGETTVPANFLKGCEIVTLDYAAYVRDDGKTGYRTYRRVAVPYPTEDIGDTEARIRATFHKDVKGGYQKDFDPSLVGATNGNGSAETTAKEEAKLPF